jgi:hypothetical protein
LEILLDDTYWRSHRQHLKFKIATISNNVELPFISTTSNEQIENLHWINNIDMQDPYNTGYKNT